MKERILKIIRLNRNDLSTVNGTGEAINERKIVTGRDRKSK